MKLPVYIQRYFWDVPIKSLDKERHARYLATRILEYGDLPAVRWLQKTYARKTLRAVARHARDLSPISRHFWTLVLNDPQHKQLCTRKSSTKKQKTIWRSLRERAL